MIRIDFSTHVHHSSPRDYRSYLRCWALLILIGLLFNSINAQAQMNSSTDQRNTDAIARPLVIAHRGASGYLPEHTLESKAMAYGMGADYLEQDVVLTRDDVPIVLHDIYLDEVTDVAKVYPERKRKDGRYYAIDFDYSELGKLKVNERIDRSSGEQTYPNRYPSNGVSFRLHSLEEEIKFIQGMNRSTGKTIGIYPEVKKPGFHRSEGKDISVIVLKVLNSFGYKDKSDSCILQCFDPVELKRIRQELKSQLLLTQLMESHKELDDLEEYARYADGIGPWYALFFETGSKNHELKINDLAERARALKLKIHPYTYRVDDHPGFESFEELLEVSFRKLGVDGVFTDFPDAVSGYLDQLAK